MGITLVTRDSSDTTTTKCAYVTTKTD